MFTRSGSMAGHDAILRFLDPVIADLLAIYAPDAGLEIDEILRRREEVFATAKQTFASEVQPSFEASTYRNFVTEPLNNATLMGRMRYYHRLPDFEAFLETNGNRLRLAIDRLAEEAPNRDDPFTLLVESSDSDEEPRQ